MAENKVVEVHLKRYLDPKKDSGNRATDSAWEITGDDIDALYVDGMLKTTSVLNSAIALYNRQGWSVIGVEMGKPYYPGPVNGDKIYPYQLLLAKCEEKADKVERNTLLEPGTTDFQL